MNGIWQMQMQIDTPIVTVASAIQYNRKMHNENTICSLYMNMYGDESYPHGCIWVCGLKTVDWKRIEEIYEKYINEFDFNGILDDKIDDTFVQIIGRNIAKGFRERFTDDLFFEKLKQFSEDNVILLEDIPLNAGFYVHFLRLDDLSDEIKKWIKARNDKRERELKEKAKKEEEANYIFQCINKKIQEETDIINQASSIFTEIDDLWNVWKKCDDRRRQHAYTEFDVYCNITGYIEWKVFQRYHGFLFSNSKDRSNMRSFLNQETALKMLSKHVKNLFLKYAKNNNLFAQYLLWTYKDLLISEIKDEGKGTYAEKHEIEKVKSKFQGIIADPVILAENGNISAMVDEGYRLSEGESNERDLIKANKYFLNAALSCHPEGMVGLAYLYRTGEGVERNLTLSEKLASLALSLGCSVANEELEKIRKKDLKPTPPPSNCFITSAVCDSFGKSDDCYELIMFRQFRDTWLRSQEDGESLIKEYYDIAPLIVSNINLLDNAKEVYNNIWSEYLKPCLFDLEMGDKISCKNRYVKMVMDLKEKYLS